MVTYAYARKLLAPIIDTTPSTHQSFQYDHAFPTFPVLSKSFCMSWPGGSSQTDIPAAVKCLRLMASIRLLMLSFAALTSPRADGGNVRFQSLLLRRVRLGSQLDQGVQWDFHPRALLLGDVHEVCVNAPQNRLVRYDQNVFAALELHDDGLQADDYVTVGFAAQVAVVVLVFVALRKVFGVLLLDLGVRQAVTDARVELVESFPFELFKSEEACGLDRSFQRGRPDGELTAVTD